MKYMELVYGVCLKYFKQADLAQDAVMDIYEHVNRKIPGHSIDNFPAWLYMVSKNHCLQVLRKKNNSLTVSLDDPVMQNGRDWHQEDEAFEIVLTKDPADKLNDCIERLPDLQRTSIWMFYFEKRSYTEISSATGITIDLVRSNIQNGRRNLKKCMELKQRHGSGKNI